MPKRDHESPPQVDKFRQLARELEADESEERFEEQVRRIAKKEPPQTERADD